MPGYGGEGVGWWIIFPIVFMVFMMIMMLRMMSGGGPMGMMGIMGGGRGHESNDEARGSGPTSRDSGEANESPLEVAQRRYAGGEISREEFQHIRDDLG